MGINLLSVLLCALLLLFSCKKYKPADPAFFIKSGNVYVATNAALQGSGSNKITDFWLYVNGQFEGAYPVGGLMPIVLKNKAAKITVFAGIKNNGIGKTRIPWQFYERFDLDTVVEAGKTLNRNFTFNYNSATVFAFTENFDQAGFKLINSPISEVTFSLSTPSEGYEGKSMKLELPTTSQIIAQVESAALYSLPYSTANVYIEFDYKCNSEFSVGLIGSDQIMRPVLNVNEEQNWNKIYISLATAVNSSPTASTYKVYFRMVRPDGNTAPVQLFLDNVKLVYI